jgi:predicted DCC family thiol-disulfide oxidoreductase YuxK
MDRVASTVVFYDGVCGLCDRLVRFLLRRDAGGRLRFAPLQGELARRALTSHGYDPSNLDTVYVVAGWKTPDERVLARSRAVLFALGEIGGAWTWIANAARVVPRPVADAVYGVVARVRYRLFGRFDVCAVPPPEWRQRFLERSED